MGKDSPVSIKGVSVVISSLALALIALGAFVRTTSAGMSCPDWPLCFGELVPGGERFASVYGLIQEYAHRALAAVVGLLTVALFALSLRLRSRRRALFLGSAALLALVLVQGAFGGLTVLMALRPWVVATHLVLGTMFFQGAALIAWVSVAQGNEKPGLRRWYHRAAGPAAALMVLCQIAAGGYAAASGAAHVCRGRILCFEEGSAGAIISGHVSLGVVVVIAVIALTLRIITMDGSSRLARMTAVDASCIVLLQLVLGVLLLTLGLPIVAVLAHLVAAQLLLFKLVALSVHGYRY